MKGNEILLTTPPKGNFLEGFINDTSLPGTLMEILPGTAPKGGRHTWRAATTLDGTGRLIAVLLPDRDQGKTATDAYVAGTRCFLYMPIPGDEMNIIVDVPGTGVGTGTETIGEPLTARNNGHLTPWLISQTTGPQFISMESLPDVVSGSQLTWCMCTGK